MQFFPVFSGLTEKTGNGIVSPDLSLLLTVTPAAFSPSSGSALLQPLPWFCCCFFLDLPALPFLTAEPATPSEV